MAKRSDTLCWSCGKACGQCSWSQPDPKPVVGWTAEQTTIEVQHRQKITSYIVRECPAYKPDGRDHSKAKQAFLSIPEHVVDQIVEMREAGMTYNQIASELDISEHTVWNRYRTRIADNIKSAKHNE